MHLRNNVSTGHASLGMEVSFSLARVNKTTLQP